MSVELYGWQGQNTNGFDIVLVALNGKTAKDHGQLFVFGIVGNLLEFGFESFAGTTPWRVYFENDQLVVVGFQEGSVNTGEREDIID